MLSHDKDNISADHQTTEILTFPLRKNAKLSELSKVLTLSMKIYSVIYSEWRFSSIWISDTERIEKRINFWYGFL